MKHEFLWLIGGLCVGAGFVTGLSGGFGVACGDVATCFSQLGYDGVDNLQVTGQGAAAIALILSGLGCLIEANRTSWQKTGGY